MAQQSEIYKLNGESLKAARRLHRILALYAERMSLKMPQGRGEIEALMLSDQFNKQVRKVLTKHTPDIIRHLGIESPALQVVTSAETYPRAYRHYPEIYLSPLQQPDYYLIAPVDYKGRHFRPTDAELLGPKERERALNLLFGGGWLGNAPLLPRPRAGAALPRDFKQATCLSSAAPGNPDGLGQSVYIAKGRSLEVVNDYLRRKSEYDAAVDALFVHADYITPDTHPVRTAQGVKNVPLYTNKTVRHDENGKAQLWVSLRLAENGEPIKTGDNDWYLVKEERNGEYHIVPNDATPVGKQFRKIHDKVLSRPDIGQYWQLWNPTAPKITDEIVKMVRGDYKTPLLRSENGEHYLIYTVDPAAPYDASRPPDALKLDGRAYNWRHMDQQDREIGIKPPPLPRPLRGAPAP